MTRIYSVTPIRVSPAELERRQRRYAALAPAGTHIQLENLPDRAPHALEEDSDLQASERAVADALSSPAAARCDYLLPDCVLDPAVPVRHGGAGPPQRLGMLQLVLEELASAGHRIGAVARNPVIAGELGRKVRAYGSGDALVAVEVLELGVDAIADATRWNTAMRAAVHGLASRGATAVINGCSAVDVDSAAARDALVVDPAATAVRRLAGNRAR
jgi:Asp/Glu/hydantoin racemase